MLFEKLRCSGRFVAALILGTPFFASPAIGQVFIAGYRGSTVALQSSGQFSISVTSPAWSFAGTTGAKVSNVNVGAGSDGIGPYQQIAFTYAVGSSSRAGSIRAYSERPVVLFGLTYNNASTNTAPFPVISSYPGGLLHMSFNGEFSLPNFPSLSEDSPWVYYDSAGHTFILSAASDYLVASTVLGSKNELQAGISTQIAALPAGFTHWTSLVFDQGINHTFETWGNALTALTGKKRPTSDSEPLLGQISYWTDNGANYYYNTASGMDYPTTFQTILSNFQNAGIALGSLQLDSWWYPKGPVGGWHGTGGIWNYSAAPDLFLPDLRSMQKGLGLPMIAHARWIDAASPIRQQYAVSGNVVTDSRYWEDTAAYLSAAGIQTYEQDWLGENAHSDFNLTDPFAFFNNMAASMAKRGITMQYCMAEPKHFLQGTNYSNLTTVRSSQDRFGAARWTEFLYSSRFASALGEFPFTDVFMSAETQNLLFATLSAGPVGIGDKINSLVAENLRLSVRADGVIVKPDVPATPTDEVFIADGQQQAQNRSAAGNMIASSYSDFGGVRAAYVVAYKRDLDAPVTIAPATYGVTGDGYVYDFFNKTGRQVPEGGSVSLSLTNGFGYWIIVPTGASGITFLGDQGQFVTMGKKRISNIVDDGRLDITVEFAPGETSRQLFGYSPRKIYGSAISGTAEATTYDATSELFGIRVHPGADGKAHIRIIPNLIDLRAPCGRPCRRGEPGGSK